MRKANFFPIPIIPPMYRENHGELQSRVRLLLNLWDNQPDLYLTNDLFTEKQPNAGGSPTMVSDPEQF